MLGGFVAVGVGAALGAWLRWGLSTWLNPRVSSFPLGTLAANLVGALVMGIAIGAFAHYETIPLAARLAITTGFLGGLTTFSAFSGETVGLILRGHYGWTALMIVAHVVGSLVLTLAGVGLVRLALR